MVAQKYRWDFIGLSTDTKPTSETSEKVVNGSTYYCSDTSKLYVYCDGTWYERKPLGGGGGGGGTSDFNDLSNRPKYNGSDMTGSTNIPEVKTYTAGSNVAISEQNVISATNTTYSAGSNVSISDQNVISATDTTYTAGTNVSISDQNVISATDTTYSAFTGTDGTAAGTAGLVPAPTTTDAGKFLKADGTWDTAGGGSGPTVVQTTGTSTTDVMSQNATTSMVYADPSTKKQIQIGSNAYSSSGSGNSAISIGAGAQGYGNRAIAIGGAATTGSFSIASAQDAICIASNKGTAGSPSSIFIGDYAVGTPGERAIAIGSNPAATPAGSIALGAFASATAQGEMNIGVSNASQAASFGYSGTQYRLLSGLYDGQSAHDAATVAQGNTLSTSAPTTSTVGVLGQLYTDTTNMHTYQCTAISGDTYTWTQRW